MLHSDEERMHAWSLVRARGDLKQVQELKHRYPWGDTLPLFAYVHFSISLFEALVASMNTSLSSSSAASFML
jgi:hypothetical protein